MVRTDKQADVRAMSSASPSSSTPPTSLDDAASVLSDMNKLDHTVEVHEEVAVPAPSDDTPNLVLATPVAPTSESRRPARSSRNSVATYNVQILAGTAIHTPTKYLEKHHKNVVHGSLEEIALREKLAAASAKKKTPRQLKMEPVDSDPVEEQLAAEAAQAARRRTSSRVTDLRRDVLRSQSGAGDAAPTITSKKTASSPSTLRRSASDSRLKSVRSSTSALSRKRARADTDDEVSVQDAPPQEEKTYLKPKTKVWLKQGLFVGQHREFDPRLSESQNRVRKKAKKVKEDRALPLPMFACDRLLSEDPRHVFRDFKLQFDIYSPLPRKVKVDGWVKLNKSG